LRIARDVSLQAGTLVVRKPNLFVSDRPPLFPQHWLGIIGADFFRRHVLTVDFRRRQLIIYAAGAFRPPGSARLRMKAIGNHNPVVCDVQLGDLPRRDYLIDVGNKGSVLIQQADEAVLRRAMGEGLRVYAFSQDGPQDASGRTLSSGYFVKTGRSIEGKPCPEYEIAGLINSVSHKRFGNMGLAFLDQAFESITIDFGQGAFYYKINPEPTRPVGLDREVYFSQEGDSFFTGPVLIGSTWYEQGLKPGMPVIHINGNSPAAYMADRRSGRSALLRSVTVRLGDTVRTLTRNK
jgi:hypothetical protein